jgi:hypothetical protein
MVSAIRHLARWLAWQLSDHDDPAADLAPASITVFSSNAGGLTGGDLTA